MDLALARHDPRWIGAFESEAEALRIALGTNLLAVHHIGSTAIPGIFAKPVIDILGIALSLETVDAAEGRMRTRGYAAKGEHGIAGRRFFQKREASGARSHHVHIFAEGAPDIERHLAFRDFLLAHPAAAQHYSELKRAILNGKPESRQVYQDAKTPFIAATMAEALIWYRQVRADTANV